MRVENWPLVLANKVEEWRFRPLQYGSADCCQFCAEVILALTGTDHRASFPAYGSKAEAYAIVSEARGMTALLSRVLGEPVPIAHAMRGDVILADFGDGLTPGVCIGVDCCTVGPAGLLFLPCAQAVCAWHVGVSADQSPEQSSAGGD